MWPYLTQDNWVRYPDPRLMGLRQDPMLLDLAFLSNSNGFRLQLDPRLLGLIFKRGPKLLNLVSQPDPLKLG